MEFAWNWMLPALGLAPLLLLAYVWSQYRRKRYVLRYSSLLLVKEAMGRAPGFRRHIPPLLYLLAVTAMLLAAARPFAVTLLPKQEATVILTMDVSGSMRADDLKPNRIEAAKAAARAFIEKQEPTTRIGVVAFSGNASLVQVPTIDHDAVVAAVNRLTLQRSTAIGSGILASLDAIFELADAPSSNSVVTSTRSSPAAAPTPVPEGYHAPAIIVLLTDGQNVQGPSPLAAAQQAADRGVRVFTIGAGTKQGATLRGPGGGGFRTELDETTLQRIAQITGGEYFHAGDENALVAIYQRLDTQLILRTERTELTVWIAGAAMALLLVGSVFSLFWFNRLP